MLKQIIITMLLLAIGHAQAASSLVVLGDSLSAGYGIDYNRSWVKLLEQRLNAQHLPWQLINASISGETSAGAMNRIDNLIARHRPRLIIIELGGNDGLRGLSLQQLHDNLATIIERCQQDSIAVLLIGIRLPDNYGRFYNRRFTGIFKTLAKEYQVPLAPFLLTGMENDRRFFQADGIHPTAAAQARILDNIWPALKPLLQP